MSHNSSADHRHAIIDQLNQLCFLFDHRDWDGLTHVMAPDVVAYDCVGRDAVIRDSLRKHLGGCGPSQHLLGNYQIRVDDNTATSVTKARVFHQGAGARATSTFECFGEYHDTWARTADGWRLTNRRFDVSIMLGDFAVLQPG